MTTFHPWPDLLPEMQKEVRAHLSVAHQLMFSLTSRGEKQFPGWMWAACWEAARRDWRAIAQGYCGQPQSVPDTMRHLVREALEKGNPDRALWLFRVARPRLVERSCFEGWDDYAKLVARHSFMPLAAVAFGEWAIMARGGISKEIYALGCAHDFALFLTRRAMDHNNVKLAHWLQRRKLWCNHATGFDKDRCPVPGTFI
jgi:hypothetical protein